MSNYNYIEILVSLNEKNKEELQHFFACSSLPNKWFLQHLMKPGLLPFAKKEYWPLFTKVLIQRGLPSINDVKNELLQWLKDPNWPGAGDIIYFIRDNLIGFQCEISSQFVFALKEVDKIWARQLIDQFVNTDLNEDSTQTYNFILDVIERYEKDAYLDEQYLIKRVHYLLSTFPLSNWN